MKTKTLFSTHDITIAMSEAAVIPTRAQDNADMAVNGRMLFGSNIMIIRIRRTEHVKNSRES